MAILKMSDMLALPVTRVPGGVMPFLKDGNGLVLFVGDQYHVDICVTAINEYDKHVAEIEALKAQVNALRKMLISVSCDSGVAVEMDINELITSAPERCLNSVKADAIEEATRKVLIEGRDPYSAMMLIADKLRANN